jgi:ligand-binding sensor protein
MAATINKIRIAKAMRNLSIEGAPSTDQRDKVIEDAISLIQQNPHSALRGEYLGVKNYSGFGDQRSDHPYGYGPKHGHIVFSVGRTVEARDDTVVLGPNEIYLLECVRDFGFIIYKESVKSRVKQLNLCEALNLVDKHQKIASTVETAIKDRLADITIETHEAV